jgi:hypothetical protein
MMKSQKGLPGKENKSAEETLRLIASLPAPDGLAERVQTRLATAPRMGQILSWPQGLVSGGRLYGNAMRGAAAAAIVCVVVGGGWRIYSRVQPGPSARVVVMPAPVGPPRGFSIGGSVHMPDPHIGPVLTRQVVEEPAGAGTAQPIVIQPKRVTKSGNPGPGNPVSVSKQASDQPIDSPTINSPK